MILIDTTNLYYGVKKRHNGSLMYSELFRWIESIHGKMPRIVYIADLPESGPFISYFKGLEDTRIVLKRPRETSINGQPVETTNFNVELTIDALSDDWRKLILCSASIDLLPLLQTLHREQVYVYAAGIPKIFEEYAHVKEISGDFVKRRAA